MSLRPSTWTAAHWLRALLVLYAVAAVVITVQRAVVGNENNFDTFRASVGHLRSGADLYAAYPAEHADRFKYSPSFPVLFAPFSVDPKWLGFFAWTLLSLGALAWALVRLLPTRGAAIALAIVLFEAIGSAQRAQTNALVAALMIAAFLALEGDRPLRAGAAVALGAVIKIFPLAALALAGTRPRQIVRMGVGFVLALLALLALPLVWTDVPTLQLQYASWRAIAAMDAQSFAAGCAWCSTDPTSGGALYRGLMDQLRMWVSPSITNTPVQLAGVLAVVAPLARGPAAWAARALRVNLLASLLLFAVLFNHQAESPTFVIAMTGIAIWWVEAPRARWRDVVLALAIIFISLVYTDLMPRTVRAELFIRYKLKTLPCLIAWLAVQWDLWRPAPTDLRPLAPTR